MKTIKQFALKYGKINSNYDDFGIKKGKICNFEALFLISSKDCNSD